MYEVVNLNIVYSYPVHWSSLKIFRDFIQNFYDAIGYKKFSDEFSYEYCDETLVMKSNSIFSKEWLLYFGVSSKRDQKGKYAGQFGEGFKIAALTAHRDFGWDITMESDDWRIHVTSADGVIAEREVKFLAYELYNRHKDCSTVLTLKGIKEAEFKDFDHAMNGFEYEANPLFGECIFDGEDISIYNLSKNNGYTKKGRIYINFQERGMIDTPIIICNRNYYCDNEDDRDRGYLTEKEKTKFLKATIDDHKIPDNVSYKILILLNKYWNFIGTKKIGIWEDTIKHLINVVSKNPETRNLFVENYGDKLVAKAAMCNNAHKKKIAMEWFKHSPDFSKRKFVSNNFTKLGIKSVIQLCQENNGFEVYREPNDNEKEYIKILSSAAIELFGDVLVYETLPQCGIIINKEAPVHAQAKIKGKNYGNINKSSPFKVRNNVTKIYIQQNELDGTNFGHAFATYMHELLHQFGGDNSLQFHCALSLMNLRVLENYELIKNSDEKWRENHADTIATSI
jgi:hypothetical protein